MTPWTPASSTGVDACCTMATGTTRCEPACARCRNHEEPERQPLQRDPGGRHRGFEPGALRLWNAGPRPRIVELPHGRDELPRVVGLAEDELEHAVALVVVHLAVRPDGLELVEATYARAGDE